MADAISGMGGIVIGIGTNILWIVVICAVAAGLFFLVRFIQKNLKKQKSFTITAIIYDLNGTPEFDTLAFVKSDVHGMLEMNFKIRSQDACPPIPKHLIKDGKVMLINFAPGHYCVVDSYMTALSYSSNEKQIIPVNLHMKNYLGAKQRENLNKSEERKRMMTEWLPWMVLGIAIVTACILAWGFVWGGGKMYAANIAQRLAECKGLIK